MCRIANQQWIKAQNSTLISQGGLLCIHGGLSLTAEKIQLLCVKHNLAKHDRIK